MQRRLTNRETIEIWVRLLKLARANKDWEAADTVRDYLMNSDIRVRYERNGEIIWDIKGASVVKPLNCFAIVSDDTETASILDSVENFAKGLPNAYSIKRSKNNISFQICAPDKDLEGKLKIREEIRARVS